MTRSHAAENGMEECLPEVLGPWRFNHENQHMTSTCTTGLTGWRRGRTARGCLSDLRLIQRDGGRELKNGHRCILLKELVALLP